MNNQELGDPRNQSRKSRILLFRQSLHLPSETFIRAQVGALQEFEPRWVARRTIQNPRLGPPALALYKSEENYQDALYGLTGRSKEFRRIIRESDIDLIHAHFGADGLYASYSATACGVPLIVTLHGRDVMQSRTSLVKAARPVSVRYAMSRSNLTNRVALALCVSDFVREEAIKTGMDESRLLTLYTGVDVKRFKVETRFRDKTLVHVARLVEKKGTEYLIKAMVRVATAHPDVKLQIVGSGPLLTHLRTIAMEVGVGSRVEFCGQESQDQVQKRISSAAAFIAPSITARNGDREGLPTTILEAMSVGTPVIATYHAGIPEAIVSGLSGILVKERDVEELAEAIIDLMSDPDRASKIGVCGSETVRVKFNLQLQTAKLEEIYSEIIGSRDRDGDIGGLRPDSFTETN